MRHYIDILNEILDEGESKSDRTGVGTISVFGKQLVFDLKDGFPLVTVKKMPWKPIVSELLWFLEGSSDERRLAELLYGKPRTELIGKKTIWTANADNQGVQLGLENNDNCKDLGRVYGVQWRSFGSFEGGVDQITEAIKLLNINPHSRRTLVSAWNPYDNALGKVALPPCHTLFQFYVGNSSELNTPTLSLQMYQRSVDCALGLPFNISSYALLLMLVAREVSMIPHKLVMALGDTHIYNDHIAGVKEMITRDTKPLPRVSIDRSFDLMDRLNNGMRLTDVDSISIHNYEHHPEIKFKMAV